MVKLSERLIFFTFGVSDLLYLFPLEKVTALVMALGSAAAVDDQISFSSLDKHRSEVSLKRVNCIPNQ